MCPNRQPWPHSAEATEVERNVPGWICRWMPPHWELNCAFLSCSIHSWPVPGIKRRMNYYQQVYRPNPNSMSCSGVVLAPRYMLAVFFGQAFPIILLITLYPSSHVRLDKTNCQRLYWGRQYLIKLFEIVEVPCPCSTRTSSDLTAWRTLFSD